MLWALVAVLATAMPSEQFDQAKLAYERSDYRRVLDLVRPLLYPTIRLASPQQANEARRLLAIADFKTGDEKGAEREFALLLNNNPDFAIDRLVDGVEVARFVDRIKQHMEDELRRARELEKKRQEEERKRHEAEAEERRRRAERVYVQVRVAEHSYLLNLLPFGAGQFQNGERAFGITLAVTEGVMAATSLALFIAEHQMYPDGKTHEPEQSPDMHTALDAARVSTGGLFFALWAVGIVDSIRHYVPAQVTTSPLAPSPALLPAGGVGLQWNGAF